MPLVTRRLHLKAATCLVAVVLAGCSLFAQPESCSPEASCIPSITWEDAVYYQYGSRGVVIDDSEAMVIGELSAQPADAANREVLGLKGVDHSDAVAMRARDDYEVAPGIHVSHLVFVRDGAFPESLCPYFVPEPPNDPAPPPVPDVCVTEEGGLAGAFG